jgi:CheY-like chemotaxis protein
VDAREVVMHGVERQPPCKGDHIILAAMARSENARKAARWSRSPRKTTRERSPRPTQRAVLPEPRETAVGKTFRRLTSIPRLKTIVSDVHYSDERPPVMADDITAGRLRGVRVLVAEDNDDSRDVLALVLRHVGALVTTASSAREALPLTPVVDVVVTDMSMPGEDGAWLLAQVEQSRRPIPMIVLTGFADHYNFTGVKFAPVLGKPFDSWLLC